MTKIALKYVHTLVLPYQSLYLTLSLNSFLLNKTIESESVPEIKVCQ